MSRIPYRDMSDASPDLKARMAKLGPLNIFRMLAHSESGQLGFVRMGNALLYKGDLDPKLRELAILRVGHLSGATYEVYQHERIASGIGLSDAKIAAVRNGETDPAFDELDRLVLRLADEIVHKVKATDATFRAAEARLSKSALVDLVLTIGYYMMVSRFLENFEVDIET